MRDPDGGLTGRAPEEADRLRSSLRVLADDIPSGPDVVTVPAAIVGELRAVDAARRRIAGDLHDGVAQSLAHIRMELELLARAAEGPTADEVGRLARVAGSALEDLRTTIDGLRRPLDGDLER